MFTVPQKLNLGGQEVLYVADSKVLKFTIDSPFRVAGRQDILNWPSEYGKPGLGINDEIFEFVKKFKCTLIIHITSENYDCRIRFDVFSHFIKLHNTSYDTSGKHLNVIPIKLCIGIPGAEE